MSRVRSWVAVGVTLAGLVLVVGCTGGDGEAGAAGGELVSAGDCQTDTSPNGTDEPEGEPPNTVEELTDLPEVPDLPPPTIPGNVSPPSTQPGERPAEPEYIDEADESAGTVAELGGLRVDPRAYGCVDFAVHLDQYEHFRIRSWGDDGIYTQVQVFSPSGQQVASWDTGTPQNFEAHYWDDVGPPEVGTYVIRTIHRAGSHNAFSLRMYGNPLTSMPETSVTTAPT